MDNAVNQCGHSEVFTITGMKTHPGIITFVSDVQARLYLANKIKWANEKTAIGFNKTDSVGLSPVVNVPDFKHKKSRNILTLKHYKRQNPP